MGNSLGMSGGGGGNGSGSHKKSEEDRRRRHTDLVALGERVSFGDEELLQLYNIYHIFQSSLILKYHHHHHQQQQQRHYEESQSQQAPQLQATQQQPSSSSSFFCDWYKATLQYHHHQHQQQQQQEQLPQLEMTKLQKVIHEILPPNFDNALYRTCFLVVPDEDSYYQYITTSNSKRNMDDDDIDDNPFVTTTNNIDNNNDHCTALQHDTTPSVPPPPPHTPPLPILPILPMEDEYTRTTKLYHFFSALSICNGRRSSKDTITILFQTVHTLQQFQQPPSKTTSTKDCNDDNDDRNNSKQKVVSAKYFIEIGYRIAVAIAYLEQQQQQQDEEEEEEEEEVGMVIEKDEIDAVDQQQQQQQQAPTIQAPPCYHQQQQQQHESKQMIIPLEAQASLHAMAMSIVEQRNTRLQQQQQKQSFSSSTSFYHPKTTTASSVSSSSSHQFTLSSSMPTAMNDSTNNDKNNDDNSDDMVELMDVLEWMETVAPMFPYILSTFFQWLLFPNVTTTTNYSKSRNEVEDVVTTTTTTTTKVLGRTTFSIPKIINFTKNSNNNNDGIADVTTEHDTLLHPLTSSTSLSLSSSLLDASSLLSVRHFMVACFGTTLNGYYFPIYNSNNDGLSFNRLQNAILGYGGPTLFILQSISGGIFGAYTGTAWKESKDFYGNTDSFLYQIQPHVAVYRPKSSSSSTSTVGGNSSTNNYMYCNSAARSRGYDQQAHGIGFGGTVQQPRLFISENFDDGSCIASAQDLTYDNGRLLPSVGTSGHYNYNCKNNSITIQNDAATTTSSSSSTTTIQNHRSIFDIECIEVYGVSDQLDVITMAIGSRTINRANKEEMIRKARKVDKAQFLDDFQSGIIASKAFVHRQQIDGRADDDCLLKKQQTE